MEKKKALSRLDLKEEREKYKAYEEEAKIQMKKCNHSNSVVIGGELRCTCGASWSGARIEELYKLFHQNDGNIRSENS